MGVAVGDIDTLMPHPVSDCQGGEAHVNQQGNVAVAKIVEPNVPRISFGTQLPKGRGYIFGLDEIADPIDTDRSPVLFVVRAPTQLAVFLLLFLDLRQLLF